MRLVIGTILACSFLGAAHAQEIMGNAAEGKRTAAQLCADCHDVSGSEIPRDPPGSAPAFIVLARSRDHTPRKLRRYLSLPHGRMTNVIVTRREAEDIISYIVALRRP